MCLVVVRNLPSLEEWMLCRTARKYTAVYTVSTLCSQSWISGKGEALADGFGGCTGTLKWCIGGWYISKEMWEDTQSLPTQPSSGRELCSHKGSWEFRRRVPLPIAEDHSISLLLFGKATRRGMNGRVESGEVSQLFISALDKVTTGKSKFLFICLLYFGYS